MKRPTTNDVARLAGVSQSTVSMILSNKANASFSEETIQKVTDAVKALNYKAKEKPDRALGSGSDFIAVVCPTLSNPYYSTLIQAIESEALAKGFTLFICNTFRDAQIEKKYLDLLSHSAACGIIYTYMPTQKEIVNAISFRTPSVIIGDKNESIDIDTIELNSEEAGRLIGEHLLSLGHRSIAFISTPLSENIAPRFNRFQGLKTALETSGFQTKLVVKDSDKNIPPDKYGGNQELRIGYERTLEAIKGHDITAIVGVNDMVAYGIISALNERGFNIPQDYSVCGFDNIFPSEFSGVALTTIDHFIGYKGSDAFEILHKKIINKHIISRPKSILKVEYKPVLVIRSTTGIVKTS